jgi:DNA polymerase III subunit epsilon
VSLRHEVPALLVGFDVETTGLDPQRDEPIAYGFAEFAFGTLVELSEFYVRPDAPIHPAAERVHGTSAADLEEMFQAGTARTPAAGAARAAQQLLNFVRRDAVFVGANPMFDFTMLDAVLRRHGLDGLAGVGLELSQVSIEDVIARDWQIDPGRATRPRRGLTNLAEHYEVLPGQHQAVEDARAAVEVFLAQNVCLSRLAMARQSLGAPARQSRAFPGLRAWEYSDTALAEELRTGHPTS